MAVGVTRPERVVVRVGRVQETDGEADADIVEEGVADRLWGLQLLVRLVLGVEGVAEWVLDRNVAVWLWVVVGSGDGLRLLVWDWDGGLGDHGAVTVMVTSTDLLGDGKAVPARGCAGQSRGRAMRWSTRARGAGAEGRLGAREGGVGGGGGVPSRLRKCAGWYFGAGWVLGREWFAVVVPSR